jgi:hypothetical protein
MHYVLDFREVSEIVVIIYALMAKDLVFLRRTKVPKLLQDMVNKGFKFSEEASQLLTLIESVKGKGKD